MKILITAFEPFGGGKINSTQALLPHLPKNEGEKQITAAALPVVFGECGKKLEELIEKARFDYIICLGQNGVADKLNVERVAINVMDARIADNAGIKPEDEPIIAEGKEAYFSTLPIKKMVRSANEAGVSAQVSDSAGTFVCNCLMYHALYMTEGTQTKAGFIHVPQTPSQAANGEPSMESTQAAKGILAMITSLPAVFPLQKEH